MSHIVQIQTQVKDEAAVQAACRRLELPSAMQRSVRLFSAEATGLAVELPAGGIRSSVISRPAN